LGGLDDLAPTLLVESGNDPSPEGSWLLISRVPGMADITEQDPTKSPTSLREQPAPRGLD
jgi:hypothetical protein